MESALRQFGRAIGIRRRARGCPVRAAVTECGRRLLAVPLALAAIATAVPPALAMSSPDSGKPAWNRPVCGKSYVPIDLGAGDYFNVYNEPSGGSCISAERHHLSWYVTGVSRHGSLWGYPNISSGIEWAKYTCHDGRSAYPSSPGSRCMRYPVREDDDGYPRTSVQRFWPHLKEGNVSYDIWFNRTPRAPSRSRQDNGAEIMIWLAHPGITEPASRICWTADIEGSWYNAMCWTAHGHGTSWNYVAYIAQKQVRSLAPTWLNYFFRDDIRHHRLSPRWWLTGIDFGAEIDWGGTGFAVRGYSLTGVR